MENQQQKESEEFQLKLRGHKLEVLKFVFTSLILGTATFAATWIFKYYELRIQSKKEESVYLEPYLDKFLVMIEKDSLKYERALEMAEFIRLTSTDEGLKDSWTSFRDYLDNKLKNFKKTDDTIQAITRKSDEVIAKSLSDIDSLSKLINKNKYSIKEYRKDSANLAATIDSANRNILAANQLRKQLVEQATKYVEQPSILQIDIPQASPGYKVIYDQDRWAGSGYLNPIIDGIVVNVDEFLENFTRAKLSVHKGKEVKEFTPYIGDEVIAELDDGDYKVTIKLIAIKNMGRKWLGAVSKEASYNIKVEKKKDG